MFEGTILTPAKKRDHRPSDGEKVSPDPKIPWHKEEDHASNPENMAAALQTSPESPSIETDSDMKEIKEMLAVIQGQMATVLSDNRKIQRDLETLKESMNVQDRELKQTQQQLTKAVAQSELLKKELDAALSKLGKQQEDIDRMWWKQDDLEQYSHKNSLELHGIPRGAYSSTEEAVLKMTNALNVIVRPEDIEISHHIRLKHSEAIIVKFVSHKVKSQVYKARTRLKNVSLTGLFQDCPASSRTESNRIHMCESLTAYRRHLVNKSNTQRRNNELLNVWTMDGKVFVKTSPEGSPIRISCDEDLKYSFVEGSINVRT